MCVLVMVIDAADGDVFHVTAVVGTRQGTGHS